MVVCYMQRKCRANGPLRRGHRQGQAELHVEVLGILPLPTFIDRPDRPHAMSKFGVNSKLHAGGMSTDSSGDFRHSLAAPLALSEDFFAGVES
jgi:hypothetical protein